MSTEVVTRSPFQRAPATPAQSSGSTIRSVTWSPSLTPRVCRIGVAGDDLDLVDRVVRHVRNRGSLPGVASFTSTG